MNDGKCHVCRRDAIGQDGICTHCGTDDTIYRPILINPGWKSEIDSSLLEQECQALRSQLSALTEERDRLKAEAIRLREALGNAFNQPFDKDQYGGGIFYMTREFQDHCLDLLKEGK